MERLGLDSETVETMKKSDMRKQALAWLLKSNTALGDEWVCQTLGMGDRSNISRAVDRFRKKKEKPVISLIKKLHVCTDWYLFTPIMGAATRVSSYCGASTLQDGIKKLVEKINIPIGKN
jgi:hypothetical protein